MELEEANKKLQMEYDAMLLRMSGKVERLETELQGRVLPRTTEGEAAKEAVRCCSKPPFGEDPTVSCH